MANTIINGKWYEDKNSNIDDEAKRIVTTAAKLIKSQIKEKIYSTDFYPSTEEISDLKGPMPSYLNLFMEKLFPCELKQSSISQYILKAVKPRSVIPPILFGLGVELDHVLGSRWLIDELHKLGFCVSYREIAKSKQEVVANQNMDDVIIDMSSPETITKWAADNVDHNLRTLDGTGTFHGMGIIAISNSTTKMYPSVPKIISRSSIMKSSKDVIQRKRIPVLWYEFGQSSAMRFLKFKLLVVLHHSYILSSTLSTDQLWYSAAIFSKLPKPRPSWSGFMQSVTVGPNPPPSKVTMLPIIDLDPSNYSCIYSVLLHIIEQTKVLNVVTPCVTFDQPLWFKSIEIVVSKSLLIVSRLGGFYTLMSFLGSTGRLRFECCIGNYLWQKYGR